MYTYGPLTHCCECISGEGETRTMNHEVCAKFNKEAEINFYQVLISIFFPKEASETTSQHFDLIHVIATKDRTLFISSSDMQLLQIGNADQHELLHSKFSFQEHGHL